MKTTFRSAFTHAPKKRMKTYELYTHGPGDDIYSRSIVYATTLPKMWIVKVRAGSIKQAYAVLTQQQPSRDGSAGVLTVDHCLGPAQWKQAGWDLPFDLCAPPHWQYARQ